MACRGKFVFMVSQGHLCDWCLPDWSVCTQVSLHPSPLETLTLTFHRTITPISIAQGAFVFSQALLASGLENCSTLELILFPPSSSSLLLCYSTFDVVYNADILVPLAHELVEKGESCGPSLQMRIAQAMPLRQAIAWISESTSQQNCVLQSVSSNIHCTWHYKVTRNTKLISHVLPWTQELIIFQRWEFGGDRMPIKPPSQHWVSYFLIHFSQQYLAFIEMLKFVKSTFSSEFAALCSSARKFSY